MDEAEVVIVGAGPAGSAAAARLSELGRDVLLLDRSAFPREKPCGDGLTHAAVAYLSELGLESLVERGQPIEDCRIVVGHGREMTGWYRPWPQPPTYARTTTRLDLDSALLDAARERGARFRQARVEAPLRDDGDVAGLAVTFDGRPGRVATRCVIGADGATSRLRRCLGVDRVPRSSQVFAARQYVTTSESLDPVFDVYVPLAYEGRVLTGYGWVFPMAERRANLGVALYMPPAGRPRARIRDVLGSFLDEMIEREADRLGELTEPTEPIGAPIAVQFSPQRCEFGNVLLCGEAARAADPLTGEGISFALRSGGEAAEAADRLLRGAPPDLGRQLGRRFPRLGQDLTVGHRLLAGAADGLVLAESEHQPLVMAMRRVTGAAPDEPSFHGTAVKGALRIADPLCALALEEVNALTLDALRSTMPLGFETMHREIRARGGPAYAATALAAVRACGAEPDDGAVALAAGVELLDLLRSSHLRATERPASEIARLNSTAAVLLGELAGTGALAAAVRAGYQIADAFAAEAAGFARALAAWPEAEADDGASPQRHLELVEDTAGRLGALAAGLGAVVGGADDDERECLERFGRGLAVAMWLGDEALELTTGEELTRRRPGSALEDGRRPLAALVAAESDPEVATALRGPVRGRAVAPLVARIRRSDGIAHTAELARDRAAAARAAIEQAGLPRPELPFALAELAARRLEPCERVPADPAEAGA